MKNVLIFNFLFIGIVLHSMETPQQVESCNDSINYKETEKYLNDDCKKQLKSCLQKYNDNDFTPQDMNNILEVVSYITQYDDSAKCIHDIKDDEQNGFFQYALKKVDLPIMQWLIEKGNIKHHSKKECADFITFCAEQLSPNVE